MSSLHHARLEQAIYHKQTLDELLSGSLHVLHGYSIADYVGSPQLKRGHNSADNRAAGFFSEQGAYRETIELSSAGELAREYNITIFATFLVIEIMPGTLRTEFLVLTPTLNAGLEGGAYVGLMASQNTDLLRESMSNDPDRLSLLISEVDRVLAYLRSVPEKQLQSVGGSWFGRLFNKGERE